MKIEPMRTFPLITDLVADVSWNYIGPRFFVYSAALEMHPLDTDDHIADMKHKANIGYCNITTCCPRVCPEHIHITDNAIIPLKERVLDRFYEPGDATASHGHGLVTA